MNWILRRLRRITLSTAYIAEIAGLRLIAIVAVVFCHLSANLAQQHGLQVQSYVEWSVVLENLERGVHLFFAINGIILTLPYARRYLNGEPSPDAKKYFRRRVFRMEPP
jgi:peptidoglycan/LPS O-acetylase OafA/YrhL